MSPSQGNLSTLLTELLLVSPLITKLSPSASITLVSVRRTRSAGTATPPLWMPAL